MPEFERLPSRIRETVRAHLDNAEQVQMCALGRSNLLYPDFVIITSSRVLVLDERPIGMLGVSYINVRCDLPFSRITSLKLSRNLTHRIFGQATIEMKVNGDTYLLCNISHNEAQRALALISPQLDMR